jgi:chromosomal replication initiation ATPase DnaA
MKDRLILKCCELFDVHERDLMGPYKYRFVAVARFALCKALHIRGWSQRQIGDFVGRDRTTIKHALERAEYMMEQDEDYAARVKALAELRSPKLVIEYYEEGEDDA